MKCTIVLCFCLGILLCYDASAQENKNDSFLQDLQEFRFSLYPYLDTMSYDDLSSGELPTDHPLSIHIQKFLDEHKKEISAYQKSIMKSYENNPIEMNNYREDTIFLKENCLDLWNPDWEEKNAYLEALHKNPIWNLMTINPLTHLSLYMNMYLAHEYSPSEIGIRNLKDRIAGPKIKTEKINENSWHILICYYYDMYEFEYQWPKNEMLLKKRYIRQ